MEAVVYKTVKYPIVVRLPPDVSIEDIDKIKVEFETEGQVFGDALGYHQKFVRIPVPHIIRMKTLYTDEGVIEQYVSLANVRLVDDCWNEKVIKISLPECFYLFKGRYRPVKRPRWKVGRDTRRSIRRTLKKLGFSDKEIEAYMRRRLLERETRNEIELVRGSIKIYLTYWLKGDPNPRHILIGVINVKSLGKAKVPVKHVMVVKRKKVNIKGVGYQPPKLEVVKLNGKEFITRDVEVVRQEVPEGLFVRIKGWIISNNSAVEFKLGSTVKKARSGRMRVLVLRLFSPRRTVIRFGHQVFAIRKLDENLLCCVQKAKEIDLEWPSGGKLHHKIISEDKEFMWSRRVVEVNGIKAVQYFLTFGKLDGGTLIIYNTQHKDIGKDRIRCHLRNGEMLVITHLDPNLRNHYF